MIPFSSLIPAEIQKEKLLSLKVKQPASRKENTV
jgi:hypothetical protein